MNLKNFKSMDQEKTSQNNKEEVRNLEDEDSDDSSDDSSEDEFMEIQIN